jgi:hypothetical protein
MKPNSIPFGHRQKGERLVADKDEAKAACQLFGLPGARDQEIPKEE